MLILAGDLDGEGCGDGLHKIVWPAGMEHPANPDFGKFRISKDDLHTAIPIEVRNGFAERCIIQDHASVAPRLDFSKIDIADRNRSS